MQCLPPDSLGGIPVSTIVFVGHIQNNLLYLLSAPGGHLDYCPTCKVEVSANDHVWSGHALELQKHSWKSWTVEVSTVHMCVCILV